MSCEGLRAQCDVARCGKSTDNVKNQEQGQTSLLLYIQYIPVASHKKLAKLVTRRHE